MAEIEPTLLSGNLRRSVLLVVDVKYLTRTDDGLLRQVIYQGLREDKPASEVWREAMRSAREGDQQSM